MRQMRRALPRESPCSGALKAFRQCDRRAVAAGSESFRKKVTLKDMAWWQMKEGERAQPVWGNG